MSKKKSVGRPRKTLADLPKGWKKLVLDEMAEGASLLEVKVLLGISNDLHSRFMEEEEKYSETIKKGIMISEAWWQKQGRTQMWSKDFNSTLWYMNMKNRFNWKDKQDITSDDEKLDSLNAIFSKFHRENNKKVSK